MKISKNNCLNIGREDHTPALFMHAPRAPSMPEDFQDQRRFGGFSAITQNFGTATGTGLSITVYRHARSERGQLQVNVSNNWRELSSTIIDLTADEMQTLACALIDAAHDIRTRSATKATAEAVPA